MIAPLRDAARVRGSRAAAALVAVILLAALAMFANSVMVIEKRTELHQTASDNRAWVLSQLEADYARLRSAVSGARAVTARGAIPDLGELTLAFDIFYSRVSTFVTLLEAAASEAAVAPQRERMLALRARLASQVDALGPPLGAPLARLDATLAEAAPLVRDASVTTLHKLVADETQAREQERALFTTYVAISVALLALMLGAAILSGRVWSEVHRRAAVARRSARMLERLFDAASDGIVVTDPDGRVLHANAAAVKLAPALRPAAEGAERAAAPGLGDLLGDPCAPMIDAGPVRSHLRAPGGSERPVDVTVTATRDLEGERILAVFIRDRAAEAEAERAQARARDALESYAEAKDRFFSAVSHEMRTPLHAVLGALDLLQNAAPGAERADLLAMARESGDRLLALVEDALDITRLAELPAQERAVSPSSLARRAISAHAADAAAHGTELRLEIVGEMTPRFYNGCTQGIARVLSRLIRHAVAAAPGGVVTVTLRHGAPGADGVAAFEVVVADDGPALSGADRDRIFEPFEVVEGRAAQDAGTGLGLAPVRALVSAMGGTVTADAAPGGGARFRVALQLDVAEDGDAAAEVAGPSRPLPAGGAALVADDAPVNVALMRRMVERLGFAVETAADGVEAVEKASAQSYALIVLDYLMPGLTGIEAARRIRATQTSAEAVILCVTAVADLVPPEAMQDGAADALLSKPLDGATLAGALEGAASLSASGTPDPATTHPELAGLSNTLDRAELDAMLGPDTAADMIAAALEDARSALAALSDTGAERTARIEALHRAVGSTSMIGFRRLGALFKQAQRELMAERDTALPVLEALLHADVAALRPADKAG